MTGLRVLALVLVALTAAGEEFSGRVVGVADGDTITVLVGKEQRKLRLYGIDCPEKGQAFGTRAKQFTSELVFGKTVTVEARGHDRYGRRICVVRTQEGKVLNEELLQAGFAWWYKEYAPHEERFAKLESVARKNRSGLWADKKPVPPWEFRARKRQS